MAALLEEDLSALPFLKKALEANTDAIHPFKMACPPFNSTFLSSSGDDEVSILSLFQKVSRPKPVIMASVICSSGNIVDRSLCIPLSRSL